MSDQTTEALTEERIKQACETLNAAFREFLHGAPSAIEGDGAGAMSEAQRNLTALVATLHGEEAWERAVDWDFGQ